MLFYPNGVSSWSNYSATQPAIYVVWGYDCHVGWNYT